MKRAREPEETDESDPKQAKLDGPEEVASNEFPKDFEKFEPGSEGGGEGDGEEEEEDEGEEKISDEMVDTLIPMATFTRLTLLARLSNTSIPWVLENLMNLAGVPTLKRLTEMKSSVESEDFESSLSEKIQAIKASNKSKRVEEGPFFFSLLSVSKESSDKLLAQINQMMEAGILPEYHFMREEENTLILTLETEEAFKTYEENRGIIESVFLVAKHVKFDESEAEDENPVEDE